MKFTVTDIARLLQGEVVGDGSVAITGFGLADNAKPGDLVFAENEAYFAKAETSQAAAIIAPAQFHAASKPLIRVANARIAFARAMPVFFPEPPFPPGVHPTAVVAASAQIDPSAHVGPHCVLGERVRLGPKSVLMGGNHVGDDTVIGTDTRLFPRAVIYTRCRLGDRVRIHAGAVIGADGFGYVLDDGVHLKVPQIGITIIEDDVEIGANSAVDRAALGATVIGKGTKIDNLVQVGHNVTIGEHCIVCGQAGIAGSTRIGRYTTLAGQVGITGHVKIGDGVTIAAKSGVTTSIADNERWLGMPAQPEREARRSIAAVRTLPDLVRRVRALEKKLNPDDGKPE